MTFRVQIDASYLTKEDADLLIQKYLSDVRLGLVYVPSLKEQFDRTDLWTASRMAIIKDFDDEGKNKPGESISLEEFRKPEPIKENSVEILEENGI